MRRAISLAINRAFAGQGGAVRQRQAGELAVPAAGAVLRPQHPRPASTTWPQAKAQMAQSSVPTGFTTTILIPSGDSDYSTIATILQAELKPLGINAQHPAARPEHRGQRPADAQVRHDADAVDDGHPGPGRAGHLRGGPDRRAPSRSSPTTTTRTVVKDAHLAEQTTTPSARQSLYNTIQTDAAQRRVHGVPLLLALPLRHRRRNVHGFFVTPLGNYHMENVWLSK